MTELSIPAPSTVTAAADPDVLVFPGDHRYDEARLAWNLAVDQRPPVVALPRTVDEVVATVEHAALLDLRIAVQGTGHGASSRPDLAGAMLVNMSRLTGVEVDPGARTARVKAGTIWADVVAAAVPHGLTALHGSAHDVGAVGYSLGGGIGWLARKHGLSASSVLAAEVVTPGGEVLRADAETNAELFWAIRGGGGSFGVVTEIEIALYPVTEAFAGWLIWPIERANDVLATWASWARTAPEEVTSLGRLMQMPPIPQVPEPLRGRQLVVVEAAFLGTEEEGRELLAPLLALEPEIDTFGMIPAAGLAELHRDPPQPVPGVGNGWLLRDLDAEGVDALVRTAAMDGTSPLVSVDVRHLEGALGRPDPRGGAVSQLAGAFAFHAVGSPMGPVTPAAIDEAVDDLAWALAPWSAGRSFLNFADRSTDPSTFFDLDVLERLQAVRAAVDPERRMLANHEV